MSDLINGIKLHMPEVKSFGELFTYKGTIIPKNKHDPCDGIFRYMYIRDCRKNGEIRLERCSIWVRSPLRNYIYQNMMRSHGIFFECCLRDDGALLIAKHGQIISSHWLTLVPYSTLPKQILSDILP